MRRFGTSLASGLLAVGLATGLAGCGGDDGGGSDGATGNEPIQVTFEGGDVTPKGERVEVTTGTVTFDVTADEPGAIHVHSTPEQEFDYEAGENTYEVTIDTPGVVEVESHDLDVVIVQLEVK
jgi:hypothetical protein